MAEPLTDTHDGTNKPGTCVVEHCYYAFDTLHCALTKADPIDDKYFQAHLKGELCVPSSSCSLLRSQPTAKLTSKLHTPLDECRSPLFVTWNTVSSRFLGGVRLRGCIGNFEPMGLEEGLKEYALIRY